MLMQSSSLFEVVDTIIANNIESFKCDTGSQILCEECLLPQTKPMKCAKCKEAIYCSKECQVTSWRSGHKVSCGNVRIRPVEGKGLGVIASRDMKKGEIVATEKPLLSFSQIRELNQNLKALTDSQKRKLMSLYDGCNKDSPKVAGIIENNVLAGSNDYHLLYYFISRFNHSCVPNTRVDTTSTDFSVTPTPVVTLKDIKKGQELCWCYNVQSGMYQIRATRRAKLKADYGILKCECESCGLTGTAQLESDQNRLKLKDVERKLATTFNHIVVPRLVKEKRELLEKEGLDTANNLMKLVKDLMLASRSSSDINKYRTEGLSHARSLHDQEMIDYFNDFPSTALRSLRL